MGWLSRLLGRKTPAPYEQRYRTVIVYVHDAGTREPLVGVHLTGPLGTAETRADGRAELSSANAQLAVVAELDGYKPQRLEVNLDTGPSVTFALEPAIPVSRAPRENLRGRFVIKLPFVNPFIALGTSSAKPDRFFMSEIDSLWLRDRAAAQRVLDHYKSLGYNWLPVGPLLEYGYSGQVPDTNWLAETPDRFAEFLIWLAVDNGVAFSLWCLPNTGPWFHGTGVGWDVPLCRRDFTRYYTHPIVQALTTRTVNAWEEYAPIAQMAEAFDLQYEWFPHASRAYHNPPGHLNAGNGDENEEGAARSMAAHDITHQFVQAHAPDDERFRTPDGRSRETGRNAIEQAVYDVNDQRRRFVNDDGNPWRDGGPILTRDGVPVQAEAGELLAHEDYWDPPGFDRGPAYRAAMLALPGATNVFDA